MMPLKFVSNQWIYTLRSESKPTYYAIQGKKKKKKKTFYIFSCCYSYDSWIAFTQNIDSWKLHDSVFETDSVSLLEQINFDTSSNLLLQLLGDCGTVYC